MRISIGMNLQQGSFGGGNQFGKALTQYLQTHGNSVYFDLKTRNIDVILLTEPRKTSQISAFTEKEIIQYIRRVNRNVLVVHRINECDERKGTSTVNQRLREANLYADYTVFVSAWLRDLHLGQGMEADPNIVIHNGSDRLIFNSSSHIPWNSVEPLKLVTHHWAGNWMKGFDIYQQLDALLGEEPYRSQFQFMYVGNIPEGFSFHNTIYVAPLSGNALADVLRANHVYITASLNDPGPNHQNEGANCGLPLLYRASGGLTEYCEGYGISFTSDNLIEKLLEMREAYTNWYNQVQQFPFTAEAMAQAYYNLFLSIIEQREEYLEKRRWLQPTVLDNVLRWFNKFQI
jgi:hypothetical protein